jgi:hypothetical protein
MHFIRFLIVLLLLFVSTPAFTQSKPQVEIQLLTNDQVAEADLNKNAFLDWAKLLTARVDSAFLFDQSKRDIMLLVTLHQEAEPELSFHARPAYSETELNKLKTLFRHLPSLHTKLFDYSFVYLVRTQGGSGAEKNAAFVPEYMDPNMARRIAFRKAGLSEKKTLLQQWAKEEVIPVLEEFETRVDAKFAGVQYMAKKMDSIYSVDIAQAQPVLVNVYSITDSVSDYWRGVMEMSPGNHIITLSKVMLLVAEGEFDFAKEYCELLRQMGAEKALATYYTNELSWRLEEFNKELNTRVSRGIALHDKGNYAGAIAVYTGILTEYPGSAWVNYELYFSASRKLLIETKDSSRGTEEWNKAKRIIYGHNPLYPVCARARTGKEGYEMYRRSELSHLFKDKKKFSSDLLELGDIAMDLGAYGYAAETYWICYSRLKKETIGNREMLPYCLYCLDKLGVKEIRKNFIGDFDKEFKKISKEQRKRMEASPAYNSFKLKE